MNFTTITLPEFFVIGIAVRTTNQDGQSQKDIGELWQRFFQENIVEQIPNKFSNDVYCIYTDYESDAHGPYTTILGCKVDNLENVPEGMTRKTISQTTYRLYKAAGKLPEAVLTTWFHIWQSPINRAYLADFDIYGPESADPNNAEVETYLSVL